MIIKVFRQVGLSLNLNGSKDLEIKIKDLAGIEVGKWELDISGITQSQDEESAAAEAILEAGRAQVVLQVDGDDINITKASLRPLKPIRPVRDRYYIESEIDDLFITDI